MKNEFIKYLEDRFYVNFDRDDRFVLDKNGNISELYLQPQQVSYIKDDPKLIHDLNFLLPLSPYLKVLHINNGTVKDMSSIKKFTHLKELGLAYNNYFKEISGLENLTELEVLDLSGNRIERISGLENLTQLRILDLSENGLGSNGYIKKIEGLNFLTKLEALYLHGNQIQVVENINQLTRLKRLTLHTNEIAKFENMDSLSKLTRLTIGYELAVFPNLSNHPLLEELGIQGNFNRIENLDYLESIHTINIESDTEINNSDVLLKHKQLRNIRVNLKDLKGTASPCFWNFEIDGEYC